MDRTLVILEPLLMLAGVIGVFAVALLFDKLAAKKEKDNNNE